MKLICGDALEVMRGFPDRHFSAACFSPPYDVGKPGCFDARLDFRAGGRFIPYALEVSRVADVWAINLTQRIFGLYNLPFMEELTLALHENGVRLWDKWIVVKPAPMPLRGQRALTQIEWVYLYTSHSGVIRKLQEGSALLTVSKHPATLDTGIGFTPYFPEIPRQMFSMYGCGRVLDPFCGTGTSLKEAQALGLEPFGIDIDSRFFKEIR